MDPSAGPDPVEWPIAARAWRYRRVLIACAVLGAAYGALYRWVDGFEVPPAIAASDPRHEPETRWRLMDEGMPEGAAGLYYVPGVGILPVAADARWTDIIPGRVPSLFQDRLNTWETAADLVELPFLPPFVRASAEAVNPGIHLAIHSANGEAVELRTDQGGWSASQRPNTGGGGSPTGVLPDEAREVIVRIVDEDGLSASSVTLPIRSPERQNAVRAERVALPSAHDAVTVAVAAVAAWPGGTAIRLEGRTDDPHDAVLLGLDAASSAGDRDRNDKVTAGPAAAVVLRDERGRTYRLRNAEGLGARRASFRWAMWLGNGNVGTKPGVDLPATLLFDALPADVQALTLSVGPIRVAHDFLLPEDADRPAEGEARETLTIPVPEAAPPFVPAVAADDYQGFDAPLDNVPLTLAGARVVARRARFAPGEGVVIELANDAASASRRLVDVFGVSDRWRQGDDRHRFQANHATLMRLDAGARSTVRVVVRDGPRWPAARATAFATAGAAALPHHIPWPPDGAQSMTVAFVRPIVEVSGRWTFELPMDVLRSNAAVNAAVGGGVEEWTERP